MMTRMRSLWVLSALALASCATQVTNESSPYYRVPVGTIMVLSQDLAVPAGHARIFFQHGKVVDKTRLDIYYPHCNFEQRTVSDGNALIRADRFRVTAVGSGEDQVVKRESFVPAGWKVVGEFDGVSMINPYVRHTLFSSNQPQVVSLTCHGGFDFPGHALTPSLADIRTVLGKLVAVELP